MEFEEIAEMLEVSVVTVKRDWAFARAWLAKNLGADTSGADLAS
jgi:DNA-directed RNA polymerase specialized sigma24 family protein